jgi:SAM-dependent methyltransferase
MTDTVEEDGQRYDLVTETTGTPVSAEGSQMIYNRYRYAADLAHGARVLEVGCGSGQGIGLVGRAASFLAGGDLNPQLLAVAERHYGGRFPFLRLRAEALPFGNMSFDLILMFEASYYLPRLDYAVDEFCRVLTPRGTIVFVNANPERPDFIPSPYSHRYHTADEFADLLMARGFSVTVEGAFPIESSGPLANAKVKARQILTRLGLVPRTLRTRALLKRMVSGPLKALPSEIPDDYADFVDRHAHVRGALRGFKVLYVTAVRTAPDQPPSVAATEASDPF